MTQHILTLNSYLKNPIETLIELWGEFQQARARRAQIKSTIRELHKLSDRELSDIGLARGDIWSVAHGDETLEKSNMRY